MAANVLVPVSERGPDKRKRYRAGSCGCLVANQRVRRCINCRRASKGKSPNRFTRDEQGRGRFIASCGHLVGSAWTERCRSCQRAAQAESRNPRNNQYKRVGRLAGEQEHRIIAARALGRPLKPSEIVHHVNMNKRDNRNRNLLICSKEYHRLLHYRMQLKYAESCVPVGTS